MLVAGLVADDDAAVRRQVIEVVDDDGIGERKVDGRRTLLVTWFVVRIPRHGARDRRAIREPIAPTLGSEGS
jgi:hypothetical protein